MTALRTHYCGVLTAADAGQTVRLGGWVHRRRDLGGLVFLDLRDRTGLIQVSCDPQWTPPEAMDRAARVGVESVVLVEGAVARRPEAARDASMATRDVEVHVRSLVVAGPAETPVIPVALKEGDELPAEELRLRHRILDLRRPELQRNFLLRHRLLQRARRTLTDLGFVEIETPILTKPTPEGARDYLVPSRVHRGEFYALPQSPQIYKQLLMAAGYDRYFQIARCFRDEDLRADRQPEFTQIDLEASFVSAADVQAAVETVLVDLWDEGGVAIDRPFVTLPYTEALERYGSDKPDLRYELALADWSALIGDDAAPFVREARDQGRVRGLLVPDGGALSRKDLDGLTDLAKRAGLGGLPWTKRSADAWSGPGVKALGSALLDGLPAQDGDLVLVATGSDAVTSAALGALRAALIARLRPVRRTEHAFAWVVDFPMFETDPDSRAPVPAHHPFTAPHPDDVDRLSTDPMACRAQHYDVVYNGHELGSGSIRVTDLALQRRIFGLLGLEAEDVERRFGFLLEGLAAGAPPHGGFALGFDRIAMLLAGAASLRDVIAFPKTTAARALFEGAPTTIRQEDLTALHLQVREEG